MNSFLILCLAIAAVNCADLKEDPVLVQESKIEADGIFHVRLETAGGTKITQEGHLKHTSGVEDSEVVEGEFLFKGDDGKEYDVKYTADENGYQPQGEHLPTPPPIPEAIQRALQYIAAHPYVEPAKKG
ncbi:endocuticle structural glycoprotein SgAbd-3-like [Eupeodes corollae]|uniref:endocuticle structural glycoprotein SgAbd-3-like n=1 Tax=Eupeodes corollae TaxID=290404 RepID=UPI0024905289|nr:endocuticle structural glycoprotein SgAbd-3-like [Eupeodes corollae]